MDLDQRNERIFIQHEQGGTYKKIAALFGISPERVKQICSREKRRFERRQSVPTLKTLVSHRLQTALQYNLYNQNLLENPEQIVALGSQKILRIRNIGRKSIKELADALFRLGLIGEDDRWLILAEYPKPKRGRPPFPKPVFK